MTADPRVVWMPGGVRTEIHLGAEDTGGALASATRHGWEFVTHA